MKTAGKKDTIGNNLVQSDVSDVFLLAGTLLLSFYLQ